MTQNDIWNLMAELPNNGEANLDVWSTTHGRIANCHFCNGMFYSPLQPAMLQSIYATITHWRKGPMPPNLNKLATQIVVFHACEFCNDHSAIHYCTHSGG